MFIFQIDNIHKQDINCVDWSEINLNYIMTGSSDESAKIIDLRTRKYVHNITVPISHKTIK